MAMKKRSALVVDDEPDIVHIVKTMLEAEGFEVLCASDGSQVFDLVAQRIPDILIIDRMMPGMNGIEVISKLKKSPRTASIPIIMLTSMDKFDDVSEGYKQGADGYITKPFTKAQIISGVNLVLASRPTLSTEAVKSHARAFLRACAKLSKRTEELAGWFAAQDDLPPGAWIYQGLEDRLQTDQDQEGILKTAPEWHYCFRGWGVDFYNTQTGEQTDLAIGPGGRGDTFDEWQVQCYIENQARRGVDFMDLHRMIEQHSDAAGMLMEYLSSQQWIEHAQAKGDLAKKELDAQLGDRWILSEKGSKMLKQI